MSSTSLEIVNVNSHYRTIYKTRVVYLPLDEISTLSVRTAAPIFAFSLSSLHMA